MPCGSSTSSRPSRETWRKCSWPGIPDRAFASSQVHASERRPTSRSALVLQCLLRPPVGLHLDADLRVVASLLQTLGHLLPRRVQHGDQAFQMLLGVRVQAQARQDVVAYGLPLLAVQQAGARVGPAVRGGGEDVPALQGAEELFQHAHHVRVAVHRPLRQIGVGVHRLAPHRRHQLVVDLPRQQRLLAHPPPGPAGSRFTPASTRLPPVAAPSAEVSPSSARNGLTVL